jgi:branched-chain amino acid transport system substrate-binding protein
MADEIDRLLGGRLTRRELLKRAGAGAGVLMVPGLISACGGGTTTTTAGGTATTAGTTATTLAAPAGTIKIGWVSPLTGPASTFGEVDPYILDVTRKALASGLEVGGKTYAVEFIAKDGQTNPAQGAAVAQELINSDKIDLMLTTSTPETINPVSDACEAAGVPCIAAMCPWEAWYFGRGAKPGEPSPFKWTYLFSFGTQQFIDSFLSSWPQVETNKKIGVMWPNDADGNAIRAAMTPAFTKAGYTVVDPGAYQDGTNDYSSQIAKFKSEGCEILQGFPLPPDFATFWRQMVQQGFKPKICQIQKAASLESEMEALGPIAENVSGALAWSPGFPYDWKLTGMTPKQLGDDWTSSTGGKWPYQMLGNSASLVEVGIAALKASGNPKDKAAVAAVMPTLSVDTMLGKVTWGTGPVPNVVATPILGGQWVKGTGAFPFDWAIIENVNDPNVQPQAKLQPIV